MTNWSMHCTARRSRLGSLQASDSSPVSERPRTTVSVLEHCIAVSSADTRRHLRSANRHLLAMIPRFQQTWNWVIGSPGQWVVWVIFHVRVTWSPGHHFDPVWDPSFSGFRKNVQNAKRIYIWRMTSKTATNQNGHMIMVIGEHVNKLNKYLSLNKLGIIKSRIAKLWAASFRSINYWTCCTQNPSYWQ